MLERLAAGRANWTFVYTAGQLAYGAKKQKEYREDRVRIWKEKYAIQVEKLKSEGVTIDRSVADTMSITTTYLKGGPGAASRIKIDPELERKVIECEHKVREHERLRDEYEGWIQALSAQPEKKLEVTQADFLFFFLNVKGITAEAAPLEAATVVLTPGINSPGVATSLETAPVLRTAKKAKLDIPPMTAPPLVQKTGEAPMTTVPALGPAAASIFIPPDFDSTVAPEPFEDDEWPQD